MGNGASNKILIALYIIHGITEIFFGDGSNEKYENISGINVDALHFKRAG